MPANDRMVEASALAMKSSDRASSVVNTHTTAASPASVLRMVVTDVLGGLRYVSHHALAGVGLAAVVALVCLVSQPDLRHNLEGQALGWLTERANLRLGVPEDAREEVLLALAEPDAIQRATAANPAELSRQQAAVAFWIARRYSVAPEPISRLVQEAWALGRRAGLDPTLVLAVMAVESGFNPFAQSHVGAQGLMQVMTRIHHDKYQNFGGQNAAFDPVTNLRVGVQVLQDCIRRAGSLAGGLKYYVGAANLPDDGGYGAKVMAEAAYLKQVASGQKVAFNATLPQAAAVPVVSHSGPIEITPAAGVKAPESVPVTAPAAAGESTPAPGAPHRGEQVALLDGSSGR